MKQKTKEEVLCIRIVNENLKLVEEGKELTKPLSLLNRSCKFKERYAILCDIKYGDEKKIRRKEYLSRPEVKARRKINMKEYSQRPEVKERIRKYQSRPEVKEKIRLAHQKYYHKNKVLKKAKNEK